MADGRTGRSALFFDSEHVATVEHHGRSVRVKGFNITKLRQRRDDQARVTQNNDATEYVGDRRAETRRQDRASIASQ